MASKCMACNLRQGSDLVEWFAHQINCLGAVHLSFKFWAKILLSSTLPFILLVLIKQGPVEHWGSCYQFVSSLRNAGPVPKFKTNVSNLRYADIIVLPAKTEADLQQMINRVKKAANTCGLYVSHNKETTKAMVLGKLKVNIDVKLGSERLEQVEL